MPNNRIQSLTIDGNTYDIVDNTSGYATLASPALTGTPTAPTPTSGAGDTQIATVEYVTDAVAGLGSGTVTSVDLQNDTNGGMSISGSPITSSGTITIGHSNVLTNAQTTQAVYPIKIDKNGHISEYGNAVTVPTITDTYSGTSSDGMSGKAVKSAIDALDGTVTGTAGAGKTLTAFSQTDGKVSATFDNISITKSQVSDFPTNVSSFSNDAGYLTSYTETDPTVPSWAKESSKPSYTFSEIGSTPTTLSGYGITNAYTKTEVDGLVSGVLHYKGTKATTTALPSSGNTVGDTWHVTADGSEWAWDGTEWQELGTAVDLSGYVPTSRTINGKALTGNITLSASDVSALPSSTTIPSVTLNGSTTNSPSFYAPTGAGTSGYFLKSNGSGAPSWAEVPANVTYSISISGNVITLTGSDSSTSTVTLPVYNGGVS